MYRRQRYIIWYLDDIHVAPKRPKNLSHRHINTSSSHGRNVSGAFLRAEERLQLLFTDGDRVDDRIGLPNNSHRYRGDLLNSLIARWVWLQSGSESRINKELAAS